MIINAITILRRSGIAPTPVPPPEPTVHNSFKFALWNTNTSYTTLSWDMGLFNTNTYNIITNG